MKKNRKLSVTQYAKKCKVSKTVIYTRIKNKEINISEGFIDTEIYPPQPKKKNGRKPLQSWE